MKESTIKALLIVTITVVIIVFVGLQFFKSKSIMKSIAPFEYKGGSGAQRKSAWYNWITPLAKEVGREYGIPWQAIAVQTALETGWGRSSLLQKYNNFGGIKAGKGDDSIALGTKEFINGRMITITDDFAVWKTPYEGLIGYAKFFHRYSRYRHALNYPNDPYKFIEEIKKAGYATDPNYTAKLHGMLDQLA